MCRKLQALFVALFSFGAVVNAQDPKDGNTQPPAPIIVGTPPVANASKGNVSYFIGFDFGSRLASQMIGESDIDTKELVVGIVDALNKKKAKLSDQEVQGVIATLNSLIEKKIVAQAKQNLEKANKYLEANKVKDGVQTTKSGLQYSVITAGTGKQPSVADSVTVHYEGKTIDGTVFDSSLKRNKPATFAVQQVVPGFGEALQRMKVGDKWQVTIPPGLAYGEAGSPPAIGPNEALIFEIELLDVSK